jgi:hypothetical protein
MQPRHHGGYLLQNKLPRILQLRLCILHRDERYSHIPQAGLWIRTERCNRVSTPQFLSHDRREQHAERDEGEEIEDECGIGRPWGIVDE